MDTDYRDDVLTLSEIAKYLKVSEKTITRLVQAGELPGAKISNQWRFMRDVIDDWLTERMQIASKEDLVSVIATGKNIIPLSKLVTPERVITALESGSKREVLTQLVEPLLKDGIISDSALFVDDLLAREDVVSTAIARNVAIPHAQDSRAISGKAPALVIGVCREGTDFDSLDGGPTQVFILTCTTSNPMHLRVMAKIALMLRSTDVIRNIITAERKQEILKIMMLADGELMMRL
jgi:PTS system nitrogen regulatory IIA component